MVFFGGPAVRFGYWKYRLPNSIFLDRWAWAGLHKCSSGQDIFIGESPRLRIGDSLYCGHILQVFRTGWSPFFRAKKIPGFAVPAVLLYFTGISMSYAVLQALSCRTRCCTKREMASRPLSTALSVMTGRVRVKVTEGPCVVLRGEYLGVLGPESLHRDVQRDCRTEPLGKSPA